MTRFYQRQHAFYCDVDLHARKTCVSIVDDAGTLVEQRNPDAGPEPFPSLIRPYRTGLVVGRERMFAWYWSADLCRGEGIDFVLGQALYMKTIYDGKTKNGRIDNGKIVRLGVQFIGQIVGAHLLRTSRSDVVRPFRMRLCPLPSCVALCGWGFPLVTAERDVLALAGAVIASGLIAWAFRRATVRLARGERDDRTI